MIKLYDTGVYLINGRNIVPDVADAASAVKQMTGREISRDQARQGTMAHSIIEQHNTSGNDKELRLRFDALTSHDITYVSIIQTARASGMTEFPVPYVLTNCHNSLCAVGGTINEDDHMFALSAARKYGGIYVPPHIAVIHSYNREMLAGCGRMVLGSDSHTRYGALGTMAVGEGGGELAKQLVGRSYDLKQPEVIGIYLSGRPQEGVGPQDVALSIIGSVFESGYVKNKVMEFVGDGVYNLDVDFRNGIDVMTTETTCWSSIWCTDDKVREYYEIHGRPEDYSRLEPKKIAYYDGFMHIDLSAVKPTIAMPFHPSNIYTIEELKANAEDILNKVQVEGLRQFDVPGLRFDLATKVRNGEIYVDQAVIAGCAGGTFDNITAAADIMKGGSIGNGTFKMSVYPGSQPIYMELIKNGAVEKLMGAGVIMREAFCGPCFGAGDTPADQELSIRHTTRNFPNREGSKPTEGQLSSVALMDARSIAATAINGGRLTAATEIDVNYTKPKYYFNKSIYSNRVFDNFGKADPVAELKLGPNIKDWPEIPSLTEDLLLKVIAYITDPVTTTDELIPSGETSAYRSNPLRLAEFTLGRKDPGYVGRAKAIQEYEQKREQGMDPSQYSEEISKVYDRIRTIKGYEEIDPIKVGIGSSIFANKPGDGSAREQAASCQRVLGAWANIAREYATKRYRSNLINWGMIPFIIKDEPEFKMDSYIFIPDLKNAVLTGRDEIKAYAIGEVITEFTLSIGELTEDEKSILALGCLINYYRTDK